MQFFKFNPIRKKSKYLFGINFSYFWRLNNFGDLLGPLICNLILKKYSLKNSYSSKIKFFSVGSALHFAKDHDVIWGTGINGKVPNQMHKFNYLKVYAVRGPITRNYLLNKNINCPEVYGDPALLLNQLKPFKLKESRNKITFIQNYNDNYSAPKNVNILSPLSPLKTILNEISESRLVIGSSVHAIIIADSLGIPARFFRSKAENEVKYNDYMYGTNRYNYIIANNPEHAIKLDGHEPLIFKYHDLLNSFPFELFKHYD